MAVLEVLSATKSLSILETTIQQKEQLGFELVTFAKGIVEGQLANIAAFHRRSLNPTLSPLALKQIDGDLPILEQEREVNAVEGGGKKLISYATVFVQGTESLVAVYRG